MNSPILWFGVLSLLDILLFGAWLMLRRRERTFEKHCCPICRAFVVLSSDRAAAERTLNAHRRNCQRRHEHDFLIAQASEDRHLFDLRSVFRQKGTRFTDEDRRLLSDMKISLGDV